MLEINPKKDEIDLDLKLLFVNVYKAVSKALGPMPHKVYRDENPSGLRLEFLSPPTESFVQRVEDIDEALGVPDGIAQNLVVPQPLSRQSLLVGFQ